MNRAISCNNHGVELLRRGELKKSLRVLREALRSANAHLKSKEFRHHHETLSPSHVPSDTDTNSFQRSSLNYSLCAKRVHDFLLRSDPKYLDPFLYTQGISLFEIPHYSEDSSTADLIVCSTVLFNLGLVHHLKGLESHTSKFLPRAESLYIKSLSVLAELEIDLGSTGELVLDFLPMALFNNLAQLNHESCNFQKCELYLEELKQMLYRIIPARYGNEEISTSVAHARRFFLLNLVVLYEAKPAAAA